MENMTISTSIKVGFEDVDAISNMLENIETKSQGEEEDSLIDYERGSWPCPKCKVSNSNDTGYCPNIVNGNLCMGKNSV